MNESPLRLTTTRAYSVAMEAVVEALSGQPSPPKLPIVDEIGIFKNEAGRWCGYIHGTAEDAAHFDIPQFISGTLPDQMGEIPCTLVLPDREIPCTIIQWKPEDKSDRWNYRALIVANDDVEGRNDAVRCFNERASCL